MLLAPGERLGSYEIIALIGSGGMGDVYKARDLQLGRAIALNVLSTSDSVEPAAGRFEHEARAASALNHPNVCHVYALGLTPDGHPFIAMEYVEGETLRKRITDSRFTIREALDIAIQLVSALSASHAVGVVHRDVKPDNVILTPDGLVKVLDFGLAKMKAPFADGDSGSTRTVAQTDAGMIVGTVAYMSPEQARGQAVDARTDIWSLGAVIYEVIAGRSPFAGASGSDIVASILEREPPPLSRFEPSVSAELVRIVSKALRKNRDERYQTAKDLLLDLKQLRAQLDTEDRGTLERPVASSPSRRWLVKGIALAAAVLVLGGILGGYLWWSRRPPSAATAPPQFSLKQITIAPGLTFNPALSRDGRFVAYASDRGAENLDLWVQQVAGGEALRLTTHAADDYQPAFSPDATTIVYRSDRDSGGIYRASALGGAEQLIAPHGRAPRVSPDGRWIAYWIGRPGSGAPYSKDASKAFVVEFDGGTPRQLAPEFAFARYPIWSPDGAQILFFGNRVPNEEPDWCLTSVKNPTEIQCLDAAKVIGEEGHLHEHHAAGDWAGDRAIYNTEDGDATDLWQIRMNVTGGKLSGTPERLTYGPGIEADAVLGQSGEIVFADIRSTVDIWSVRLDPKTGRSFGRERRLTSDPADDVDVRTSGSGSALVFASNRAGEEHMGLWVRDLRTSKEMRVTSGHLALWPALDWHGERIAYLEVEPRRPRKLHVLTLRTGQNETVCTEQCGSSTPYWTRDGSHVLTTNGNVIRAFSLAARRFTELVQRPPYKVWEPNVSPDGKHLLFLVREHETKGRIVAAPLNGDQPVKESDWVVVSADGTEDKPRWSADGRTAYFTSERDGFRCIWAQPVVTLTIKPAGAAFAAHHSHTARRSLKDMPLARLGIGVTSTELFFNQTEKTGNLWMMRPVPR